MNNEKSVRSSPGAEEAQELSTERNQLSDQGLEGHMTSTHQQNRNAWSKIRASIPVPTRVASLPFTRDEKPEKSLSTQDISADATKWTRRRDIPLAILAWSAVILGFFWLSSYLIQTILLVVIACLLAYAFAPLVTILTRWLPRAIAIMLVYVVVLTGIGFLLFLVVKSAIVQITTLTDSVRYFLTPGKTGQQLTPLEQALKPIGISSSQINAALTQLVAQLEGLTGSIVPLLTGVAGAALDVILVLVLSIYLLIDGAKIMAWFRHDLPQSQHSRVRYSLNTVQRIVGGYIRGQLIMSTLIGILVGGGLLIIGIPYALLLGVLAFFLEFIPTLGTIASGAICVLVALTRGWISALIVLIYFILVHIFEGDVVGPRIVGKAVGLHPIVSLAALIAGAELFGIWGALFASPVAGILQAVIVTLWTEWRETHPERFRAASEAVAGDTFQTGPEQPFDPETSEKLLS